MPGAFRSQAIRARVFMNGDSQTVRIPPEFRLDCEQVTISRNADGDLILRPQPANERRGDALLRILASFDPDFVRALVEERDARSLPQGRGVL
ncbi:MAG: AbrB/MazE/SpoVT family DNA-binding domain-containing protein [Pseudomonadota bacterium]|nr:AbrB/MazE/SpoVT family DNA-binding domain-containing protein [Pseudomonadota bacterium]